MHKNYTQSLCVLTVDKHTKKVYNIYRTKESEVKEMLKIPNDHENDYGEDELELQPTKPLSAERRAEIEELYAQMAADLREINGY